MKIAFNALSTQRNMTGSCRYYRDLIKFLLKIKSDVRIENWVHESNYVNYNFKSERYNEHRIGGWTCNRVLRIIYEQSALGRKINKVNPDLFHGNGFIPYGLKCPAVVTIHDLSYFRQKERTTPLRSWYFRKFTRISALKSLWIITDSEASKKDIEHFIPEAKGRVAVIPIATEPIFRPVDDFTLLQNFLLKYKLKKRFFLYLGTLEPGKNLVRLINAYNTAVSQDKIEVDLVIAGKKGWLFGDILKSAEKTALLNKRIFFLDYVPEEELPILYNAAECLVFPSLNEGFGLPPLEAMSCGTPVITSNISSLPEVVGDAAITINPLIEDEIRKAMVKVSLDENLRLALRDKGLERAKMFSWENTVEGVLKVYERALSS